MAYIEREKVKELIKNFGKGAIEDGQYALDSVDDIILLASAVDLIPSVDAVEVVHGEWIKNELNTEAMREWHKHGIGKAMSEKSIYWTCSRCGRWGTPSLKYCPNCGAKMDGKRKVSE